MDITTLDILEVLHQVGKSIRVPTACYLLCDMFPSIVDSQARGFLVKLEKEGRITVKAGGWIVW